ncbi:L-histidine N(alpha)-methyltransferase [Streptomyces sp. NPDC002586]
MSPFHITRLPGPAGSVAELRIDVLDGLTAKHKTLAPKWLYDTRGSRLFEDITQLPEYYPTRTERALLSGHADQIAAATDAHTLIELGSGSAKKTSILLDALPHVHTYVPIDLSESALTQAGQALQQDRPRLHVHAVLADFTPPFELPDTPGPRLTAILGSTIGNLMPGERAELLAATCANMGPADALLMGVDLVKNEEQLLAAYDDTAGVTAEFNKNVLAVINRELRADFDPDAFIHVALWNADHERVEMRLRSRAAQSVRIPALDLFVDFAQDEELRTETAAKFREAGVRSELTAAGLALKHWWTDPTGGYGLALAVPGAKAAAR